jgi:hypothetical protein
MRMLGAKALRYSVVTQTEQRRRRAFGPQPAGTARSSRHAIVAHHWFRITKRRGLLRGLHLIPHRRNMRYIMLEALLGVEHGLY